MSSRNMRFEVSRSELRDKFCDLFRRIPKEPAIQNKKLAGQKTGQLRDLLFGYAAYCCLLLRMIRKVLTPNGRSNKAPAIIVLGSGTAAAKTS